jgi:hypothetical protein
MKAIVKTPFADERRDDVAIICALWLITLHELYGFGKGRLGQALDGFNQALDIYKGWLKEGKFSADAQLNAEMKKICPDWKNIFNHTIGG